MCWKEHLQKLIERNKPERIIYAQRIEREGKLLLAGVCNNNLEGIVAKRKRGIYKSNSIGWPREIRSGSYRLKFWRAGPTDASEAVVGPLG